jgi:hypothetical protein
MSDYGLSPPPIHPEFGYFWPSGRVRRRIRWTLAGIVSAVTLVAARQASPVIRENFDVWLRTELAESQIGSPSSQSAADVVMGYSIAPFPNFRPRFRAPNRHPYAHTPIGKMAGVLEPTDRAELTPDQLADREAYSLVTSAVAESTRVRTVTVRSARGGEPRVFIVPIE